MPCTLCRRETPAVQGNSIAKNWQTGSTRHSSTTTIRKHTHACRSAPEERGNVALVAVADGELVGLEQREGIIVEPNSVRKVLQNVLVCNVLGLLLRRSVFPNLHNMYTRACAWREHTTRTSADVGQSQRVAAPTGDFCGIQTQLKKKGLFFAFFLLLKRPQIFVYTSYIENFPCFWVFFKDSRPPDSLLISQFVMKIKNKMNK